VEREWFNRYIHSELDFNNYGIIGFLAAKTMPSRAGPLMYSLHAALPTLAHRTNDLKMRPEGAIVHADLAANQAAQTQLTEADCKNLYCIET